MEENSAVTEDIRRYIIQLARYVYYTHLFELEKTLGHEYNYDDTDMSELSGNMARFCINDYLCDEFYEHVLKEVWIFGILPKMTTNSYFEKLGISEMALTAYDLYLRYGTDYMKSTLWLKAQIENIEIEKALI